MLRHVFANYNNILNSVTYYGKGNPINNRLMSISANEMYTIKKAHNYANKQKKQKSNPEA